MMARSHHFVWFPVERGMPTRFQEANVVILILVFEFDVPDSKI